MGPAVRWRTDGRDVSDLRPDIMDSSFVGSVSGLTLKRTTCSTVEEEDEDDMRIEAGENEGLRGNLGKKSENGETL